MDQGRGPGQARPRADGLDPLGQHGSGHRVAYRQHQGQGLIERVRSVRADQSAIEQVGHRAQVAGAAAGQELGVGLIGYQASDLEARLDAVDGLDHVEHLAAMAARSDDGQGLHGGNLAPAAPAPRAGCRGAAGRGRVHDAGVGSASVAARAAAAGLVEVVVGVAVPDPGAKPASRRSVWACCS